MVLHFSYDSFLLSETLSKNMTFKKSRRLKSNVDLNLCKFLYFICDIIFGKTFRTAANFLHNSLLSRNIRFLISSQVFNQLLWKLVQMERTCFKPLNFFFFFVKYLAKGVKQGPLYDIFFQSSSKQFQSNQRTTKQQ